MTQPTRSPRLKKFPCSDLVRRLCLAALVLVPAAAVLRAGSITYTYSDGSYDDPTPLTTNSAAPLTLIVTAAGDSVTQSGEISGNGSITKSGAGTLTFSGSQSYTGGTIIASGTLALDFDVNPGSGPISFTGGTLRFNANAIHFANTFSAAAGQAYRFDVGSNVILSSTLDSVNGSLTKLGHGVLYLYGSNAFSGATVILDGSLSLNSYTALQNSTLNYTQDGGTFSFSAFGGDPGTAYVFGGLAGDRDISLGNVEFFEDPIALTVGNNNASTNYSGVLSGGGPLTKTGTGTLTLSGANRYSGGTTVLGGVLKGDGASLQGSIVNNATVEFAQATDGAYAGVMSGTGNLTKSGSGTLTLSGANTYTGGTTVSGGTLKGDTTSLQGPIVNNAVVEFAQPADGLYAGAMSGSGSLTKSGSGTLTLTGTNSYTGGTTVSGGVLKGNAASLQGPIVNNAAVEFAQPADGLYAGAMSGSGSLTKSGSGTLTLTGTNTYAGATQINGGKLAVSAATALGSGNLALDGGTLITTGPMILSKATTLGAAGGTLTNDSGFLTINGNIIGSGGLTKTGSRILTLAGTHTYTGATTVSAGTLKFSANGGIASALATSNLAIASGATVIFADSQTYAGGVSGAGLLEHEFSGTTILTGTASHTGGTTIIGGTIQIGNGGSTGALSGNVTLSSNGTLAFNRNDAYTFAGSISGTGGLTQLGSGTLTLSGANTYTGATVINSGTLQVSGGAAVNDTSAVSLANTAGATLALGASETIGSLAGGGTSGGNVTLGGNTLTVGANDASTSYGGAIIGTGSLTKTGAGMLTLSGNSTYTGVTTISGGTLALTGTTATAGFAVSSGGILDLGGKTLAAGVSIDGGTVQNGTITLGSNGITVKSGTISANLAGDTSMMKTTTGTVTLSGNNTYSGTTFVKAGALVLGSAQSGTGSFSIDPSTSQNRNVKLDTGSYDFDLSRVQGLGSVTGSGVFHAGTSRFDNFLSGTGSLVKDGTGTFQITGGIGISGNVTLNQGTILFGGTNFLGQTGGAVGLGSGRLTINGGALETNFDGTLPNQTTYAGDFSLGRGLTLAGATTLAADVTVTSANRNTGGSSSSTLSGVISGGHGLTFTEGTNPSGTLILSGANTYTGGTALNAGILQANTTTAFGTGTVRVNAGTLDLNSLAIANALDLRGGSVSNAGQYAGTATIHGAFGYSGTVGGTQVVAASGLLNTTGATFTGSITVESGGTLSGTGTAASVTVESGGTLAPGNSPGRLMLTGDLTLGGTTEIQLGGYDRGVTFDAIDVGGALTFGGTLKVTLIDGFTLHEGDAFDVFDYSIEPATGHFAAFSLPSPGPGLGWQTANLYTTGSLSVIAVPVPEPVTYAALAGAVVLALAMIRRRTR